MTDTRKTLGRCAGNDHKPVAQLEKGRGPALAVFSSYGVKDKRIAVIGGGAAGITFAAVAASLGGDVTLFEKAPRLLPMQLGCWHRPLHPEIFTWPDDSAFRPVSHLPQLGWTIGRAHDVADTLLGAAR